MYVILHCLFGRKGGGLVFPVMFHDREIVKGVSGYCRKIRERAF